MSPVGTGLGLLVRYFISLNTVPGFNSDNFNNNAYQAAGVIYGASVLLFGGLGLLVAFIVELKFLKKKRKE